MENDPLFLTVVSLTVCLAMATSFAAGALGYVLMRPLLPEPCDGVRSTDGRNVCIHPAPPSPIVYYGFTTLLPLPEVEESAHK